MITILLVGLGEIVDVIDAYKFAQINGKIWNIFMSL